MPLDAPRDNSKDPAGMSCIVVGGCAHGALIQNMKMDAEQIELSRPRYMMPLASSKQLTPDVKKETDIYTVHPLGLTEDGHVINVYGIAVVAGQSLAWAYEQLLTGFIRDHTAILIAENLKRNNKKH